MLPREEAVLHGWSFWGLSVCALWEKRWEQSVWGLGVVVWGLPPTPCYNFKQVLSLSGPQLHHLSSKGLRPRASEAREQQPLYDAGGGQSRKGGMQKNGKHFRGQGGQGNVLTAKRSPVTLSSFGPLEWRDRKWLWKVARKRLSHRKWESGDTKIEEEGCLP